MILLERLIQQFPTAKRQTLKRMVEGGRVTINGVVAGKLKQELREGDVVHVSPGGISPSPGNPGEGRGGGRTSTGARNPHPGPPPEYQGRGRVAQPAVDFPIVFEDDDILVIDKPPGLLTSTGPREKRPTALAMLRQARPDVRIGLIHRLDRDASGLLVFSKNQTAFGLLKKQFAQHTVTRLYAAVVSPPPKRQTGVIESHLTEWKDGTVHSSRAGQTAKTEYVVERTQNDRALLHVKLYTGRKHQIRVHLSERGSPVIGDSVYKGVPHKDGLMLAAVELQLTHPQTMRRVTFKIELPRRMAGALEA